MALFAKVIRLVGAMLGVATLFTSDVVGHSSKQPPTPALSCAKTVTANVVALDQPYTYNRFGSFNPAGMMFALRRDVVEESDESVSDSGDHSTVAEKGIEITGEKSQDYKYAGNVSLRDGKRPRPLVLRVNEGDCLSVNFTNLLDPFKDSSGLDQETITDPETGSPAAVESDEPATRYASMHVNGLNYFGSIESDGSNVGRNDSSLAAPGETKHYVWYAKKEGGYLFFSMAAPVGGEGDGGQLGLGLFGSVNVEPRNSRWFRSQVSAEQLQAVTIGGNPGGTPKISYNANYQSGLGLEKSVDGTQQPILAMLNKNNEIVHSDLNAIVAFEKDFVPNGKGEECSHVKGYGNSCGLAFREFTTIFHDELTAVQSFQILSDEEQPISKLKDGMGVNYGAAGLGAMVLANREGKGPAANCVECKLEEFFLSSWAMGDPAMNVRRDAKGKAYQALYPDDPSNVHHSYVGDPVRFRNMHAGPKETHVFHLHAHQWVQDWSDENSVYLDSQTISPGSSFTYEIHYGGSGNRNHTPGDSIFHCHLYPHFAQGMWELWRAHDVFESGTADRNLPDGEILDGTPTPAVVPLPNEALPPMPTADFKGYPFYIAGTKGHRPPQAPNDIDPNSYAGGVLSDTLHRHVVLDGERLKEKAAVEDYYLDPNLPGFDSKVVSSKIAKRVMTENPNPALLGMASKLVSAEIRSLPEDGTVSEKTAIRFHAGQMPGAVRTTDKYGVEVAGYPTCDSSGKCSDPDNPAKPLLFHVNGMEAKPGAPFADPCPSKYYLGPKGKESDVRYWHTVPNPREYKAAYVQFDMTVNKSGWHDPQARIIVLENDVKSTLDYTRPAEPLFFRANSGECVIFKATNLVPSNLNVDDFQIFSPTDEIGQHIHLVKFDVTSSDGSANGWNYEDATLSPEEVRERIAANNAYQKKIGGTQYLVPKTHRMFLPGGVMAGDARGVCPAAPADVTDEAYVKDLQKHPWCGAQTTIQRWWADPLLGTRPTVSAPGDYVDRTIRTVFTHDHLGPSSHQHHGLYAALVIEPTGSTWEKLDGQPMGGANQNGGQIVMRPDGGPTSYAANIVDPNAPKNPDRNKREYGLAFADFSILYTKEVKSPSDPMSPGNFPVNPANRIDHELPQAIVHSSLPAPEAISSSDPGSQLLNYRNDPIALRVGKSAGAPFPGRYTQRTPSDANLSCEAIVKTDINYCAGSSDANCVKHYCDAGDLANAFSSVTHRWQDDTASRDPKFLTIPEPAGLRNHGDPGTPLLGAFEGDRVQLRLIQGAQEENHVFTMHGMKWLAEPDSPSSGYKNGQQIGISEHFEFDVHAVEKNKGNSSDHLYYSSAVDNLWDGQWGLMRVWAKPRSAEDLASLPVGLAKGLKPLPSNEFDIGNPNSTNPAGSVCPPGAPTRRIFVVAVMSKDTLPNGELVYNKKFGITDPNGLFFVKTKEMFDGPSGPSPDVTNPVSWKTWEDEALAKLKSGQKKPEPLILRAAAGECIKVRLRSKLPLARGEMPDGPGVPGTNGPFRESWSYNMLPPITEGFNFNQIQESNRVGLYPQLLSVNMSDNEGANVGNNADSTVPGRNQEGGTLRDSKLYTWYAGDRATNKPIEFGVAGIQDMGDVIKHSSHGAVGAIVIEPQNATWKTDCDILPSNYCLDAAATVTYSEVRTGSAGLPILDSQGKALTDKKTFREFVAILQNDVSAFYLGAPLPNLRNGDDSEDSGQKAINFGSEPLWARLRAEPEADPGEMNNFDYRNVYNSIPICSDGKKIRSPADNCKDGAAPLQGHGDPATPLFTVVAGEPLRIRIVEPSGHPRNHAFSVFGHDWPVRNAAPLWPVGNDGKLHGNSVMSGRLSDRVIKQPNVIGPANSDRYNGNRVGTENGIGPSRHADAIIEQAGGNFAIPGDYMYRTHEGFTSSGGMWGIMRVLDRQKCHAALSSDNYQYSVSDDEISHQKYICR